jgi:hypothetical protein
VAATGALTAVLVVATVWVVPAAVASSNLPVAPVAVATPANVPAAPPPAEAAGPVAAEVPVGAPSSAVLAAPATVTTTPVAAPPAPDAGPPAAVPPAPGGSVLPSAPAAPLAIGIHATGYQAELDRCFWVRMDLAGASAPIVGAHHHCGGDIVLAIEVGDAVDLSGQGLDGRYVAIGSRDARPGQDAGEATEGMGAQVILQTCYPSGTEVRLVALARIA